MNADHLPDDTPIRPLGRAKEYIWEISRTTGTPAKVIGRVETSDDKPSSAIKAAIERFGITDPVQQERLAARRVK